MSNQKKIDKWRKRIVGLVISWKDSDPTSRDGNITMGSVRHKNPVHNINAKKITQGYGEKIFYEHTFKWLIEITGIFHYPNKQEQRETRELRAVCNIKQISDASDREYLDIRRCGSDDAYITTEFKVTCIGLC